jgi:hypothetical protein
LAFLPAPDFFATDALTFVLPLAAFGFFAALTARLAAPRFSFFAMSLPLTDFVLV